MTLPEKIARAKELLGWTSLGPWAASPSDGEIDSWRVGNSQAPGNVALMCWEGDSKFIALSRELVPELIAEVERLEGCIENYKYDMGRTE